MRSTILRGIISILFSSIIIFPLWAQSPCEEYSSSSFAIASGSVDKMEYTVKAKLKMNNISDARYSLMIKPVDSAYSEFKNRKNNCAYNNFHLLILSVTREEKLTVDIKFITKKEGAIVKYRPLGDKNGQPCNQTTNNCTARGLAVGRWEYWAERNGVMTSEVFAKDFTDDATVEIDEKND